MPTGWPEKSLDRLALEDRIIRTHYPTLRLLDPTEPGRTRWEGVRETTFGNWYTIRILLPTNYPLSQPRVYVIRPSPLRDCGSPSSTMHCLSPDQDGNAQICHYDSLHWGAHITLDYVMRKVDVWLHAYDVYLREGTKNGRLDRQGVSRYLPEM